MLHWSATDQLLGCICRHDTDSKGMVANSAWLEVVYWKVDALTCAKLLNSGLVCAKLEVLLTGIVCLSR